MEGNIYLSVKSDAEMLVTQNAIPNYVFLEDLSLLFLLNIDVPNQFTHLS
jgi:hypothetical protein